jgi:hypothetical protein
MNSIPRGPDITKAMRPFGDPTVYVVEAGQIRGVPSPEVFLLAGYKWSDVRDVEPNIIFTLPRAVDLDIPPAVRSPQTGKIYHIVNGVRHWIKDQATMQAWGFTSYSNSSYVDSLPEGLPIGVVVQQQGDGTVYLMQNGFRRAFASPYAFMLNNYSWSNVTVTNAGVIDPQPLGVLIQTPILCRDANNTYYYIWGGKRYQINDTDTFNNYRFGRWDAVLTSNISQLSAGSTLTRLPRSESGAVYRVTNGVMHVIPSPAVFAAYGFSWSNVTDIPYAAFSAILNDGGVIPLTSDTMQATIPGYPVQTVAVPATTGGVGKEQHLWTTLNETSDAQHYALTNTPNYGESINLWNGVATNNGAFGKLDPSVEKYYITMRWNYVVSSEDTNTLDSYGRPTTVTSCLNGDCTLSALLKAWHNGRKLIVTNPTNNRRIVVAIGDFGPSIWVTRERGVVAGMSPEATDYIVGSLYGIGGVSLQYGWAMDQTLPLGPLIY